MMTDPIVDEIRGFRDEHAKQHNYDLEKITAALIKSQNQRGVNLVKSKPKPVENESTDLSLQDV